jgi:16S rRNA (cytosine1402-N4)-methyltransferase
MSIKEHPPQLESSSGEPVHVPVLLESVIDMLQPQPGDQYLDLTAGYGGHARAILAKTTNYSESVLVDRDAFALSHLQDLERQGARTMETDFVSAARQLIDEGKTFDMILADLGVSSPQLDRQERGFSFRLDGPLDMRMDRREERTAADIVNSYTEQELVRVITTYGEEPRGRAIKIVKAIVVNRPFTTTAELAETVKQAVGRTGSKHHPATRTFQSLRIELNRELDLVANILPLLPKLLNKGGRVAVISFHSLEDRLVKRFFKDQLDAGYEAELEMITKKPIDGSISDVNNPRSRSAKLRAAVKK